MPSPRRVRLNVGLIGKTLFLLLSFLGGCPFAFPFPADAAVPLDPRVEMPDALGPLLAADPDGLDMETRLQAAEILLTGGRPGFAAFVLEGLEAAPDEGTDGLVALRLIWLRFLLDADLRWVSEAVAEARKLDPLIAALKPSHRAVWDRRLADVCAWLRDEDFLETGRHLARSWSTRFPSWPYLRSEELLWLVREKGAAHAMEQARRMCDEGRDAESCMAAADVAFRLRLDVETRALLLEAWRKSSDAETLRRIVRAFADLGDRRLTDRVLRRAAALDGSLANLELLALSAGDMGRPDADIVQKAEVKDEAMRLRKIRLLLAMGDTSAALTLAKKSSGAPANAEDAFEALLTFRALESDPETRKQAARWRKERDAIWTALPNLNPSPLLLARMLLLAETPESKAQEAAVLFGLKTLDNPKSLLSRILSWRVRLLSGRKREAVTQADFALNRKGKRNRAALWEAAAEFKEDGLLGNDPTLVSAVGRLAQDPAVSETPLAAMQAVRVLDRLGKHGEAVTILERAAKTETDISQRIEYGYLLRDLYGRPQARKVLESLTPRAFENILKAMVLAFHSDRHEMAQGFRHGMAETEEGRLPLLRAEALLDPYLAYRESLTFVRKKARVSLDMFTHFPIQDLRRHAEAMGADSRWPEIFRILASMENASAPDPPADRELPLALAEANRDTEDAALYFLDRLLSFGLSRREDRAHIAAALAMFPGRDAFDVARDAILSESESPPEIRDISAETNTHRTADAPPSEGETKRNPPNAGPSRPLSHAELAEILRALAERMEIEPQPRDTVLLENYRSALPDSRKGSAYLEIAFRKIARLARLETRLESERKKHEDRRRRIRQVIARLNARKEQLDKHPGTLSPRRLLLRVEPSVRGEENWTAAIGEQIRDARWMLEDCFAWETLKEERRTFGVELETDEDGLARRITLHDFPSGMSAAAACLRRRLNAYPFKGVEASENVGEARIELQRIEAKGWTVQDIQPRSNHLTLLSDSMEAFLKERNERFRNSEHGLEALHDKARHFATLAYEISWNPEIYDRAAWWFVNIEGDAGTADKIRREGRWLRVFRWGLILLALAAAFPVFRRLRRKRRERGESPGRTP